MFSVIPSELTSSNMKSGLSLLLLIHHKMLSDLNLSGNDRQTQCTSANNTNNSNILLFSLNTLIKYSNAGGKNR